MSDETLIEKVREKSQAACKLLVERYAPLVYNTALGLLQDAEDAEDVSQEVFAYVFQSAHHFRGEAKLSTWLYRIAVSKSLDSLKARKRMRLVFLSGFFSPKNEKGPAFDKPHFHHPGVLLENQENAEILFWAIGKLPEQQKTAFVLHKMEDLPYQEIAAVMQTSVASVESLLFRAKQNLRQHLGEWYRNNYTTT